MYWESRHIFRSSTSTWFRKPRISEGCLWWVNITKTPARNSVWGLNDIFLIIFGTQFQFVTHLILCYYLKFRYNAVTLAIISLIKISLLNFVQAAFKTLYQFIYLKKKNQTTQQLLNDWVIKLASGSRHPKERKSLLLVINEPNIWHRVSVESKRH